MYPKFEILHSYNETQKALIETYNNKFFSSGISLKKIYKPLEEYCDVFNGLNLGNVRHLLLSDENKGYYFKKMVLGKDIKRYSLAWSGIWVNYDVSLKERIKPSDIISKPGMTAQTKVDFALRNKTIYIGEKILVRKTADKIIASLDIEDYYYDSLSYGIKVKKEIHLSIYYFLALLNSKAINHFHDSLSDNKGKVFAKVLAANISKLPIPLLDLENAAEKAIHQNLANLSKQMLAAKAQLKTIRTDRDKTFLDNKCISIERQIDKIVYQLFELTQEEIAIIEKE